MNQSDSTAASLAELAAPLKRALAQKLLAMGDDELLLAHRNSEWCGHAPILEEDIAFANIAQDELGHAGLWYGLLEQLDGSEPDRMVFFRPADAFRNSRLLELPNGDWALSILRQYLFDSYELLFLEELSSSRLLPLAYAAAKAQREEVYHLRHSSSWVQRLGLGTDESNRRMQAALDTLWPYGQQLFIPLDDDPLLVDAGIIPSMGQLGQQWRANVSGFLTSCSLSIRDRDIGDDERGRDGRDVHTEHLAPLVEELQSVARADPQASW